VVEREWREASDMRASPLNLFLVLGVAAVLRFWALGHGIPFAIGVDEPEVVGRVVAMMKSGDFNPRFFDYPGLIFYMHLPVVVGRFMLGALAGEWTSLNQVGASDFYLTARALTALLGTLTVYVLYQVGQRWGARHALLGAGLLAVMPMHVRESHYALTDVPATFFATLTMLLSLVAHEKATWRAFAWAGVAAGLTIGTKYNAGVVLMLPLLSAVMTLEAAPSRGKCVLAVLAAAFGTFLLVAPYTLLDLPGFLNGFAALMGYYKPRPPSAEPGWIVYLKHLRLTMGWPASMLLATGLVLGTVRAVKGPGRLRWTLLVLLPIVYFAVIGGRSLVYGRYLLPLLPFTCLLAAIAVVSGVSLLRRFDIPRLPRRLLIAALTVAALLPPLSSAIGFDRRISRESTQEIAWKWIAAHVPRNARIVIEKYDLRLPEGRYRVEHVVRLTDRSHEDYVRAGHEYIVATSQVFGPAFEAPHRLPALYAAYRTLFDQSQELLVVKPEDPSRPGPELRIYRLVPQATPTAAAAR
jgi:4-amino-4-deoxy-L-arabinose transferase-like glycosyltransferase